MMRKFARYPLPKYRARSATAAVIASSCRGIMSWPWFVDLRVKRVIEGALPSMMVRVLTIQHTYRVSREGTWLLRKNTAGGYNVVVPEDGAELARCSDGIASVEPYIRPGDERTLDDLRDAGIRRYGHHTN